MASLRMCGFSLTLSFGAAKAAHPKGDDSEIR